ncbi:MAG: polysaccharide biosynthesis tyrosine autokinase [Nitrospirae bacterium]|nr:polysaccharide biosynthesis tyrosine autokinase [Nitrospirota bacterium]
MSINIDYYKTQYEILKGYEIFRIVARQLNLKDHREYTAKPLGRLESWYGETKSFLVDTLVSLVTSPTGQDVGIQQESQNERKLVAAFKKHVTVKPVMNSRIIRISVESIDPQLAANAANAIAAVYITRSMEMKSGAAEEATKWITTRVEELRRKVQESEQALQLFANRYSLVNIDEKKRLVTQKLGDLQSQLVQAETKRVEAEARFKQIESVLDNPKELESSSEVLSSSLIANLRSQESQVGQKVAELNEKYGPRHPTLVQAASELKEIQARIQHEIKKVYTSVKVEYEVAKGRERVVRNALDQQKSDVMASGQHEVQYGILEREAQSNRQLYDMFLKRMKETDIAIDIRSSNIYISDPAIVSFSPIKPKKTTTVMLAALVGILSGLALAFFLDYMDSSFKSPDDITHYLPGVAFLGFLPIYRPDKKASGGVDLAAHEATYSIFAEHVRSVRTSLLLSAADKAPRLILVTSAMAGEGKSSFSINLAVTFAQLGHPTVLIDGDLRKPRIASSLGLQVTKGLSHYLVGEVGLQEIIKPTMVPNLKCIPCGAIPPNPAELLQSKHMSDLLENFRKEGVYVVVDCSPVLAVTDPRILGPLVDGTILVVGATKTPRQAVRMAAKRLTDGQTRLLGVVLQRLAARDLSEYSGYYSYYGKAYGKKPYGEKPDESLVKRS